MIWDPQALACGGGTIMVEEIMDELQELCGEALTAETEKLKEVASAIEVVLDEQDAGGPLDSSVVMALASRALWSVGEERAARRLYLLGSGMVRPSEWNAVGDTTVWMLDLAGMVARGGVVLEIEVLRALHGVLESISDVWDDSDGRGVLGLLHLDRAATRLCGAKQAGRTSGDIVVACSRKLARIGAEKGWSERPRVMSLDI